jgi:hypothetical protein
MQQMLPQVPREEAIRFSQVWRSNGIAIPLDVVHINFATDFANICLRNFVLQCQSQVAALIQAQQVQNQAGNPAEQNKQVGQILVEG